METNNNRPCVIQYESPIIISRGSNPHNPFAEDPKPKSVHEKISDFIVALLVIGIFADIVVIFKTNDTETKNKIAAVNNFKNGADLWCKAGYDVEMEIKINQQDGWVYDESRELFVNDARGLTMKMNNRLCREKQ